jgi:hypothetical protein
MNNNLRYTAGLVIGLLCAVCTVAQDYSVSLIPDSLKENANMVKRFEETRVVIRGIGKAVVYNKYAYTILNEEGDRYAEYTSSYSKLRSLSDISGRLFDASGKVLRSVKKKDITDYPYDDESTLASDYRYKSHNFNYRQYPYTVEYEDEITLNGIYTFPAWQPVRSGNIAIQQERFVIETDPGYQLRYKQCNYVGTPLVGNTGKVKSYVWEVKNLAPLQYESFQPGWEEVTTRVMIAPGDFEYSGYQGNMSSWQDIGKFGLLLNQGRDILPEPVKKAVHDLADSEPDKKEKIRKLYEYLQQNTRYISIQLGIGGLQPFDATYVATKKYGDCKALSNYMTSLLKEAGIRSHYVWVNAGKGKKGLQEDFPNDYFNHIIVCVPDAKDSMWLECTSQTSPAGYMGSFTGNRQALLITEEGGKLAWTPRYQVNENEQLRRVDAVIDAEGNLSAEVSTVFTGIQQEETHGLIHSASKEQREKYLNSALNLPTYKVDKIEYAEQKKVIPVVNENLHITSAAYATVSGKRLFITPNLFNRLGYKLSTDKPRHFDIEFTSAYRDVDTIIIKIPEGYTPEALPKNVAVSNKFGKYEISFTLTGNLIRVLRVNEMMAGRYPPADYEELAKFYADMYKADRNRMVFVKN